MENKGKIIGIDYGVKRVGLAVCDESQTIAFPLSVITNGPNLIDEIIRFAKLNNANKIVIGESRDFKGQPNEIFLATEKLKQSLIDSGLKVDYEPEFLTSAEAERIQGKNDKIDASAATIILQSYLNKLNNSNSIR